MTAPGISAPIGIEPTEVVASPYLKNPNHTCCTGIDVPGVGLKHAYDCPSVKRMRAVGREHVAGEVPQPLRDFVGGVEFTGVPNVKEAANSVTVDGWTYFAPRVVASIRACLGIPIEMLAAVIWRESERVAKGEKREALLARLIFAARDLADYNLGSDQDCSRGICIECGAYDRTYPMHLPTCRTGRVLGILDELMATLNFDPKKKEVAPGGEGCAGDGIRPRGLHERVCLRCGERGGKYWTSVERRQTEVDLSNLGMNQCFQSVGPGNGLLFTHCCPDSGCQGGAR